MQAVQKEMVQLNVANGNFIAHMSIDAFAQFVNTLKADVALVAPSEAVVNSISKKEITAAAVDQKANAMVSVTRYCADASPWLVRRFIYVDEDVVDKAETAEIEVCFNMETQKWMSPVLTTAMLDRAGVNSRSIAEFLYGPRYRGAHRVDIAIDGGFNYTRNNFKINQ